MSLSFYFDHNGPDAVAGGLRRRSVDVILAREDGRERASDDAILERATELDRVVFTHDGDFLEIAPRWNAGGRHFAGIVYAHPFAATVGQFLADLELIAKALEPEEIHDRLMYLPL